MSGEGHDEEDTMIRRDSVSEKSKPFLEKHGVQVNEVGSGMS